MTLATLLSGLAFAQQPPPPPPPTPPPGEDGHYFELSMTAGPVLGQTLPGVDDDWLLPMAELFFEARQGTKGGIGLVAGVGTMDGVTGWEVGLNGRAYPAGDFEGGLILGAEAMFLHKSARLEADPISGISFGPIAGFKYIFSFGLTVEATGGVAVFFAGPGFNEVAQSVGPIANASLGWSL